MTQIEQIITDIKIILSVLISQISVICVPLNADI